MEAVRRRDVGFGLLVTGVAMAAPVLVLRLWRADLHTPLDYHWDSLFNLMTVKGVLDHGGYNENPSLGAPYGQELYDLAMSSERLNLWLIEGLGFLSSDPAVVMNLFYLLTFPLTALSAFLCLRLLEVSAGVATVLSLLYSLLPYHFFRGEDHLYLSAYYSVPLAAYLIISVLAGKRVFARREAAARGITAYASGSSLLALAFCVVIGSTGVYTQRSRSSYSSLQRYSGYSRDATAALSLPGRCSWRSSRQPSPRTCTRRSGTSSSTAQ